MERTDITLDSEEHTQGFGVFLGENASGGDVICLDGDLGAGKTTLTQAIAKGMRVDDKYYVTSPSFNVFHEYPGRIPLYHMDFYRLRGADDVIDMGLDEYFYMAGVTVIEWASKAESILPADRLSINLQPSSEYGRIAICTYPETWSKRMVQLQKRFVEKG